MWDKERQLVVVVGFVYSDEVFVYHHHYHLQLLQS